MDASSKRQSFFKALACLGQFAALFSFAVFFEAVCLKKLVVWHFFAIYAAFAVFRASGRLIGTLVASLQRRRLPKSILPLTNFLSRIGFAAPTAAFIALGVWLKSDISVYFYILPACIVIYFGGNFSVGRSYSEIFSRGWFLLDLFSSIAAMIGFSLSEEAEVISAARYLLCVGFAAVTLLSAVLANQTNIDTRTNQRDAGKAFLPEGLRRYNALLVIGTVTLTLGLFVFAKPLAAFIRLVIEAMVTAYLFLTEKIYDLLIKTDPDMENGGANAGQPVIGADDSSYIDSILFAVIFIVATVLIIRFRKQILKAIKDLFAPLFKSRGKAFDTPFADEITSSHAKQNSPRAQKKAEHDLERQYARETSPERKYRLGYALFLARLRRTEQPPVPSDTTDIHREKGETVFGEDLQNFSETYNKVRYADLPPTMEELAAADELLKKIK